MRGGTCDRASGSWLCLHGLESRLPEWALPTPTALQALAGLRGRPPEPQAPVLARPALSAGRPLATKSSVVFTAVPGVAGGSLEDLSTVLDEAAPRCLLGRRP